MSDSLSFETFKGNGEASPFPLKVSNDRESLTPAAKDGTLRVLNAGIDAGVQHFVKTSSIVCMFRKPNRSNPYTFGENDWTDLEWDKTTDYFVSKTRALVLETK